MTRHYKCPHCEHVVEVERASWDEHFAENLPKNLLKATLVVLAGVPTAGLGSVILGGVFYGQSVAKFVNGTKVTCGACGQDFRL